MTLSFWLPQRRSSPGMISDLFLHIIPESTQAALGCDSLSGDHILSLPEVGTEYYGLKGVYFDCATRVHPQQWASRI
jgi:hypothetical protein